MRYLFFLLLFAVVGLSAGAQPTITTNSNGEAIVVFPDGSSMLFSDYANGRVYPDGAEADKYPVLDVKIAPLAGKIDITADDLRRIAERKVQLARNATQIAQDRAEQAQRQRKLLEEQYTKAQKDGASGKTLDGLSERLAAARQTEEEARREVKLALSATAEAEQITTRGTYVEDYLRRQKQQQEATKQYDRMKLTAAASYENLVLDDNNQPFAHTIGVILRPPVPKCQIAYEGKDDKGRFRRDLAQQLLFTHTDERLRPHLEPGREYLRCEGFLTQLGGFRFLTLEFTFAYPNAREAYGFIEKGSYLMIRTLNEQFVTLFSGKLDRGTYDTETQLLTYQVHYPLDQGQLNLLKRSEVDKIVVAWSSGYEEYEVYQLGFFMGQVGCLE